MKRPAETTVDERLPIAQLRAVFEAYPISLVVCFGSQATGRTHAHSDVDLAIAFDGLQPGVDGYKDVFFEVYAEVVDGVGRDDVDLVDVHSVSPSLARAVLESGILIYGEPDGLAWLREAADTGPDPNTARERLDDAIERMDEHLA
jgi:predicted nucleotidyltransferase